MKKKFQIIIFVLFYLLQTTLAQRHTILAIEGDRFFINGRPTLQGCCWNGYTLEGLLPNARMVQGIFDDLNPATRHLWNYPDSGKWDAGRNTREFIQNMKNWRDHGLLAFTINIQGGSPYGYSKDQPWINPGFYADGSLRPDYFSRLEKILDRADELGMAVILGIFYFGQDQHLKDEQAVIRAIDNTLEWIIEKQYTHLIIEVNNESNPISYDHDILKPARVHELIRYIHSKSNPSCPFIVSTSFWGGVVPTPEVVEQADLVLLHGNGLHDPAQITALVDSVRRLKTFTSKPIVFNEDDHFDFENPDNNFFAATRSYASWGFFDYRMNGEPFTDGFQSIPVDWSIGSARKKSFFDCLSRITKKENCNP